MGETSPTYVWYTGVVAKRRVSKLDPDEVIKDLQVALYFTRIGYPYYGVPTTLRRALKVIRRLKKR